MKINETYFPGLLTIEPDVFSDPRGYFFESYNNHKYNDYKINFVPVQDNESSSCKGVIRGLHYQEEPFAQAKLIRVIEGRIYDVALDIRRGSPTFGKWFGIIIDSEKKLQFLIPKGFAHGFSVLSERAIVLYKCDNNYSVSHERGINAMDPDLGIDWMIRDEEPIISQKDVRQPLFKDISSNFTYIK